MDDRLKNKLKKEFEELLILHPTKNLVVSLELGDAEKFSLPNNDAFICDKIDEYKNDITIVIHYNNKNFLTETDKLMLKRFNVIKEHLPFWYLYHEYGHLLELDECLVKSGFKGTKNWLSSQTVEIERLMDEKNKDEQYKNLVFEKNADLFANNFYMTKVKELKVFFDN